MEKRIFVSIDLPKQVKDYLGSLGRSDIYWIKWANPKNYHITLSFLGDLKPQRLAEARGVLTEVAPFYKPFTLKLAELKTSQDMLWLLPEKNEVLEDLQSELKSKLRGARVGKRERRGYMPHVLLARSKTGRAMQQIVQNFQPVEFPVDKINLYNSELTPGSATHTLIESFPLA